MLICDPCCNDQIFVQSDTGNTWMMKRQRSSDRKMNHSTDECQYIYSRHAMICDKYRVASFPLDKR